MPHEPSRQPGRSGANPEKGPGRLGRRPSPLGLMGDAPTEEEGPKANPLPSLRAVLIMVIFTAFALGLVLWLSR
jgi:hypothetical protein